MTVSPDLAETAAEQSASVVIEPAPLASQLAPDLKCTYTGGVAGGGGGDGCGGGGDGRGGGGDAVRVQCTTGGGDLAGGGAGG